MVCVLDIFKKIIRWLMKLNPLNQVRTSQDVISVFKGYNHNLSIDVGEFYDMENLSSNAYPLLTPRPQRGYLLDRETFLNAAVRADTDAVTIMETTFLLAVGNVEGIYTFVYDSGDYKLDGTVVTLTAFGIFGDPQATFNVKVSKQVEGCAEFDELLYFVMGDWLCKYESGNAVKVVELKYGQGERQLIPMGGRLVIMPDKLVYDGTINLIPMDSATSASGTSVTFTPCIVGSENATVANTAPGSPNDGDYWLDTDVDPNMLKRYSSTSSSWTQIATDSVMITYSGIGDSFEVGDGIEISGIVGADQIEALNGANVIKSKDTNYIVITGMISKVEQPTSGTITFKREMPDMDFVIECKNRLWGCKYGDGLNEIYASKLGDPTNWNCFEGLSTDSFASTVGKDGSFTGAVNYFGYPLFFKEDTLYKVHGDYPANYRVVDTPVKGVLKGSHRSLAIVGSTLFYKSRNGICAYNGSLPSEINLPFGGNKYDGDDYGKGASGGAFNNKYYISMKDDKWHLFVYDTSRGLLHREDNTHASYFCATKEDLIYFDAGTNEAMTVNGYGTKDISLVKWMADTGEIGMTSASNRGRTQFPEKKYLSRMLVRFSVEMGSMIAFYIQYDSNGTWEKVSSSTETRLGTMTTEIRPKRCDHFRIKIIGEGGVKLYSITKIYHRGSDF